MYIERNLVLGSKIRTRGKFLHYGIVFYNSQGHPLVIHNLPERGVVCTTLEEFSGGQPIETTWKPRPGEGMQYARKAYNQIGKPYDLFSANCEHFANWVVSGVPSSEQVQIVIFSLFLVGVVALIAAEK